MGSSQSTKVIESLADRLDNCDIADHGKTQEVCSTDTADDGTTSSKFSDSLSASTSEASDVSLQTQISLSDSPQHSRHSSILIFDLDDTLIPTEWIRSSFVAHKHKHATAEEVYQVGSTYIE